MADIELRKATANGTEPYATLNVTPVSQNVAGNYTNVRVLLQVYRPMSVSASQQKSYSLSVGGHSWSGKYTINGSGTVTLVDKTVSIYHNDNGVGSVSMNVSVQFGVTWSGTSIGTLSGSKSKSLTTIPRVSDISIDKTEILADNSEEAVVTISKKAASFTDEVVVKLGDYSKAITSGTAFTIPKDWINAITGVEAVATVTVTTKSGTTVIGSKSVELTVKVPTSVVPTVSGITTAEAVAAVTTAFGARILKGVSMLNVQVEAAGVYGSTIKSYTTEIDGVKYLGQTFQTNVFNSAGTIAIKTTVIDSRGREKAYTKDITVIDYEAPAITDISYVQCNSDGTANSAGTCTKITVSGKVASVESQNTRTLTVNYKKASDPAYTSKAVAVPSYDFTVETIISGTTPDETWEFVAELKDKISAPVSASVETGKVIFSAYASGKGMAFFKEAERDGLDVGGGQPGYFTKLFVEDLYLDDPDLELSWDESFPGLLPNHRSLKHDNRTSFALGATYPNEFYASTTYWTFEEDDDGNMVASASQSGRTETLYTYVCTPFIPVSDIPDGVEFSVWLKVDDVDAWDLKYIFQANLIDAEGTRLNYQTVSVTHTRVECPEVKSGEWVRATYTLPMSALSTWSSWSDTVYMACRFKLAKNGSLHYKLPTAKPL